MRKKNEFQTAVEKPPVSLIRVHTRQWWKRCVRLAGRIVRRLLYACGPLQKSRENTSNLRATRKIVAHFQRGSSQLTHGSLPFCGRRSGHFRCCDPCSEENQSHDTRSVFCQLRDLLPDSRRWQFGESRCMLHRLSGMDARVGILPLKTVKLATWVLLLEIHSAECGHELKKLSRRGPRVARLSGLPDLGTGG
jgi:hypothetical protein